MDMHNIPVPLYFRAWKYHRQSKLEIDDFSKIPRPFYTICRIHDGTLFMDGKTGTLRLKSGDMFLLPMGETYVAQWRGNLGAVFPASILLLRLKTTRSGFVPIRCSRLTAGARVRKILKTFSAGLFNTAPITGLKFLTPLRSFTPCATLCLPLQILKWRAPLTNP